MTTTPSGCCVRKGTPCGHSACIRAPFPVEAAPRVPQHPPDECPMRGRQPGQHTTPPSRERARRPPTPALLPWDEQRKRTSRLLLLDWSSSDMRPRQCPLAAELDEARQRPRRSPPLPARRPDSDGLVPRRAAAVKGRHGRRRPATTRGIKRPRISPAGSIRAKDPGPPPHSKAASGRSGSARVPSTLRRRRTDPAAEQREPSRVDA